MAQTRIAAPNTTSVELSTSYLGEGENVWISAGARRIVVWINDGTDNVKGTVKFRIGAGDYVEFTIPASNGLVLLETAPGGPCLPPIELDGKAASGSPKLAIQTN
jgi:hypothetical protein